MTAVKSFLGTILYLFVAGAATIVVAFLMMPFVFAVAAVLAVTLAVLLVLGTAAALFVLAGLVVAAIAALLGIEVI